MSRIRSAFTMVELVFVIVVLGIVSSIGAELIANVYKGYVLQRAHQRAEIKTELAAQQIANRLRYAIPRTVVRRDRRIGGTIEEITAPMSLPSDSYIALQWVGWDGEGFEARSNAQIFPGWSGFFDLGQVNGDSVTSPNSDLPLENRIIQNLSKVNGASRKSLNSAAIFFPDDPLPHPIRGMTPGTTDAVDFPPPGSAGRPGIISEHYRLAWSGYAVAAIGGNLWLYYNLSTTPGADIPANADKALLLRNVTHFKFTGQGRTIRFKICKSERISENAGDVVTACKEKAVF